MKKTFRIGGGLCLLGSGAAGLAAFARIMGDRDPSLPPLTALENAAPLLFLGLAALLFGAALWLFNRAAAVET